MGQTRERLPEVRSSGNFGCLRFLNRVSGLVSGFKSRTGTSVVGTHHVFHVLTGTVGTESGVLLRLTRSPERRTRGCWGLPRSPDLQPLEKPLRRKSLPITVLPHPTPPLPRRHTEVCRDTCLLHLFTRSPGLSFLTHRCGTLTSTTLKTPVHTT